MTIDDGDAAAREGRWSDAVAIWISQRSRNTNAAEARLRWFLANAGTTTLPESEAVPAPWPIILGAGGLGFLGTAIVLVGEDVDGAAAVVTSVAAWACYLASGILILMYSFARHVAAGDRDHLSQRDLEMAIATAREVDAREPAPGQSPS